MRPVTCAVGLAVVVLSCGGGTTSPTSDPRYTPPNTSGPRCTADADCGDGVYCNGDELCLPADPRANAQGCVRPLPFRSCGHGEVCVESAQTCAAPDSPACDTDGDGHRAVSCGGDDCDDADANRYPGNAEVCDAAGHDEDCDPTTLGPDKDGDGQVSTGCCNLQPGGARLCGYDCNDDEANVHQGAPEACDHVDNDCDGIVDNGVSVLLYPDVDRDGYGTAALDAGVKGCPGTVGYSELNNDCDDANAAIVPGEMKCSTLAPLGSGILTCSALNGAFDKSSCPAQQLCHPQPNGTGVCL